MTQALLLSKRASIAIAFTITNGFMTAGFRESSSEPKRSGKVLRCTGACVAYDQAGNPADPTSFISKLAQATANDYPPDPVVLAAAATGDRSIDVSWLAPDANDPVPGTAAASYDLRISTACPITDGSFSRDASRRSAGSARSPGSRAGGLGDRPHPVHRLLLRAAQPGRGRP